MSNDELIQKEAPLPEKAISHNRMDDYLGMVTTPSKQEKATQQTIREIQKTPVVMQPTKPQIQEASQEELESRRSLLEDYMGNIKNPTTKQPVIEVVKRYNNDTENYIKQLEEQQTHEPSVNDLENEPLRPKTLTSRRLSEYLDFVEPDINHISEELDDFIEEDITSKGLKMVMADPDDYLLENELMQYPQHKDEIAVNNYDKYEFKSYIGTEFEKYLKQQYGNKKAALLDRMFLKQYDILSKLEDSDVEEQYYQMVDQINTNYDRNTQLENFKNLLKFFSKFYHFIKFKEDELTEQEEDLLDVIQDIYNVLNRTVTE